MPQFSRADGREMHRSSSIWFFRKPRISLRRYRRRDEIWICLNVIKQPLLVRTEPEIVIVFLQLDHFAVNWVKRAVGTAIFFREKRLFLRRIKSLIGRLVKMAGVIQFGKHRLHKFLVARSVVRTKSSFVSSRFLANDFQSAASASQ